MTQSHDPFQVGKETSLAISEGLRKYKDASALGQILKDSQKIGSKSQDVMQQIFSRVSPENQTSALNVYSQQRQQQQKQQAAQYYQSQGMNPNIANLDIGLQKEIVKQNVDKKSAVKNEKIALAKAALESVRRQKELLMGGHLGSKWAGVGKTGAKWGSMFSRQGNLDRAEYARIGRGLITQATTLNIRNKDEFKAMREGLDDPRLSQEEIEGNILGMEKMITDRIKALEGGIEDTEHQPTATDASGNKLILKNGKWEPVR